MRAKLYLKILGWFVLNVLLLIVAVLVFLRTQFDFDLNGLMSGRAGSQVDAVSRLIEADLRRDSPTDWDDVLRRYEAAYGVQFSIYRPDGVPIVGVTNPLPEEVDSRFVLPGRPPTGRPPPPPPLRDGRPPANEPPPPQGPPGQFEKALIHSRNPSAYWALVEISMPADRPTARPNPAVLLIRSSSLNAGGLFFDVRPWLICGSALFVGSALFWLPFVRRITGSLSRMTDATRRIADGNFDVTLEVRTRDELGSLAASINRMAARLDGFVSGQKRFLGDIAHELCAPLARTQIGLGILEERAPADHQAAIADVREEADQMSSLVNELLAFSKASLGGHDTRHVPVDALAAAERAIRRETAGSPEVVIESNGNFSVMADEHLLERALANLIRNALRYANGSQIVVTVSREEADILISVADSGPGVPEAEIARIFDPFFRVDASRSRQTGGVGLGLAIVKNCVELCGGSVSCRNLRPTGLEVTLRLQPAP